MPRFNITAQFDLSTEIEPELYGSFDSSADEFSDESYWGTQNVTADGGDLRFVVEADSEEDAQLVAAQTIFDGQEVEDRNGLTWLVENLNVEVEEVIPPLTTESAKLIVSTWLGEQDIPVEVKEALQFLLARVV
jgi:hypothetical protein